jgi:hypothetical protein
VSFSGETVASIQSGILTYGQIKLKIPTWLIWRWYFNINNPAYWRTIDKTYAENIDHRLVLSSDFFTPLEEYIWSTEKQMQILVDNNANNKLFKSWWHFWSPFCSETNKEVAPGEDHADIFSKKITTINNIIFCIIYRDYQRSENEWWPSSNNSIEFYLPNTKLRYTIILFNYSQQEAKEVFDSLIISK